MLGFLLVALLVLPAFAVSGPTKLRDPDVSPTVGTPTTLITFSVTYTNKEGSPADWVRVLVAGTAHEMTAAGSDWKKGVPFTWSGTLPVGQHGVVFSAMGRDRFTDEIAGPTVVVNAPPPSPTPTPKPTPAPTPTPVPTPTPKPTPAPTASPTPTATPRSVPTATPQPTPAPTATPTASSGTSPGSSSAPAASSAHSGTSVTPVPSGDPIGPGTPGGAGGAPTDPSAEPDGVAGGSGDGGSGDGGTGAGGGTGEPGGAGAADPADWRSGQGWGDLATALDALGVDSGLGPELRLIPSLVGSTTAVGLALAFGFLGKRRRDGEPPEPDEVLEARAARGGQPTADGSLVATGSLVGATAGALDAELAMPRWRRPSLLQARKADPIRDAAPVTNLSFAHGLVSAVEGRERRIIRYHLVNLLDAPDELRGAQVGTLTQGDEVQLMERSGTYWLVLCPDGQQGWIHKMTLGDAVGDAPAPSARQTWATETLERDDVDDDVLSAFMAARGRA